MSKKAIIAGAGPAGLTAAYELLQKTDIHPEVHEATDVIGGISQTVRYNGNRMDIGGHRFFSKNEQVMDWWMKMMPVQGARSKDDILLDLNDKELSKGGPDPEKTDRVILLRHRVSRIFFLRKFFDYPISMKKQTFLNMGFGRMIKAGFGYLWSCVHKLPETSLENFYINRFGRPLYELFFEGYSEKVWGIHPSKLGADWGSQRVKGLSVMAVIKDLIAAIDGIEVPEDVRRIARELPYRDFITVGLCVDRMKIKNETKIKTYQQRVPDTWIYIQERDVKIGRLQVFNNWSPYLVADYENTMWIGLEYFCTEGDELWEMPKEDFIKMAVSELEKIDIIEPGAVKDACHVRIKKAYPAYYGSYYEVDTVKQFLDGIENLFCLGRNGQHRYNNMDHSMLTAMECVENIKADKLSDKSNIWNVNTETEYHESKAN